MVNTIFASHLIESKARLSADEPPRQTTEIQTVSHCKYIKKSPLFCLPLISIHKHKNTNSNFFWLAVIEENGVRLRLNIVDTPGYGDQVNNENW